MSDYFLVFVGVVFINNYVLVHFLGLCPLLGTSRQMQSAYGMSLATCLVLGLSSTLSYAVYHLLLVPNQLEDLRLVVFIGIIASSVQFLELAMRYLFPFLHHILGVYLPLITTNCAVLGVVLIKVQHAASLLDALAYGLMTGLGFSLVLVLFASLRHKLNSCEVPKPFRGSAIALITAGFMSLAFLGFSGLGEIGAGH